jgi:uncharacterized protein
MLFVNERKTCMSNPKKIQIEIVYARSDKQILRHFEMSEPCTIESALEISGFLTEHPELIEKNLTVGIFGKKMPLSTIIQEGDRIEIYRPLILDPKTARLIRVKKG